jgi:DNA-binding transcriptional regulator YdaS (Cro superfamily)
MNMNDAIGFYGSKAAIARALGVASCTVTSWGESIPPLWACRIHLLTGGQVMASKSDLMPSDGRQRYRKPIIKTQQKKPN